MIDDLGDFVDTNNAFYGRPQPNTHHFHTTPSLCFIAPSGKG
jgi:hypothetical protein